MALGIRRGLSRIFLAAIALELAPAALGASGDEVWKFQTGNTIFGSPALGVDGTVYVGSRDSKVYAITKDGKLKWSFSAGDWVDSAPTLSLDGSTVYFGSWDNRLYAVDTATGTKRWSFATGNLVISSPAIDQQGNLYFGSSDGFFYSLTSGGSVRWSYFVGEELDSSPAVAADGTVYVGAFDGVLYAFAAADGSVKWTFQTDQPADAEDWRIKSPPTIAASGEIYFGGGNGEVYALSPTGQKLWSFGLADKVDTGIAIDQQGRLLFGCRDGSVYCLDGNGVLEWESYVGDIFYSTPSIDAWGRIAVGSYLGNGVSGITALEPDGSVAWEYLTLDYIDSSPLFDNQGRAIFGCYDGVLYAVESGAAQGQTEWSRFGGDVANRSQQIADPTAFWTDAYMDWARDYRLAGSQADPASDGDSDGIPLGLEFLLGGSPEVFDAAPAIEVLEQGGETRWTMRYPRRKAAGDLALEAQLSSDLISWRPFDASAPGYGESIADPDLFGDGLYELVQLSGPVSEGVWARLRAKAN